MPTILFNRKKHKRFKFAAFYLQTDAAFSYYYDANLCACYISRYLLQV